MTFLVWLNSDYEGGETYFRHPGMKMKGGPGDGLLFRTRAPRNRDPAAEHAVLPVSAGEK